jgi:uncharacterized membrane protein YgcG
MQINLNIYLAKTTALLRHALAAAALFLSLGQCIEGKKRVLMLASLALRRHCREASGHVRMAEALLSCHHRSPCRFEVAAMGVGASGSMLLCQPSRCRLFPAAMSSCVDWSRRCVSDDARIALSSAAAFSASAFVGSWARNSSSSESSSSSPCGGAGSYGGDGGGGGGGGGGAPEPPHKGAWRRL